jgi:uncharacterized membrane protein
MWLLGLLVGAIIGAIGGGAGAFVGAVVGLVAGIVVSQSRKAREEKWRTELEGALSDLRNRVRLLEARLQAAPEAAPAPAVEATREASAAEQVGAAVTRETGRETEVPLAPAAPPAEEVALPAAPAPVAAAAEPTPVAAAAPSSPGNFITRWLFGGNTLVRVGVVLLFFGVAFLLKYAAERDLVPIELRVAAVALGGVALLVLGWRLRERRAGYALVLQGGGIGVLYLTVFAAFRLYHLVPAMPAFFVLAAIAVLSAMLAVLQDARSLAVTGIAGGFLAPVLASTGAGSHVALFSFYAVLNGGILGIAWYKAWRELNLVGFAFTFVIGLAWGAKYYRPELFASTEPFLVLFFVFYVAIAVLFALRRAPQLVHYVDGTLVFGTPIIAFGLQTALVRNMEFGGAWSACALGAFYLVLASLLYSRRQESLRLLVESFLALGVGFGTLAVPLAFDGRWTSAVWAIEGAAIVWVGVRQGRMLARWFGMLLQFGAGVAFLLDARGGTGALPVLNSAYLGTVMVSAAGLFCSRFLARNRERVSGLEGVVATALFVWGVLWWFGGGLAEIDRVLHEKWGLHPHLLFFAGSCALFAGLWRRLDWNAARVVALAAVPLGGATAFLMTTPPAMHPHPFAHHAYLGWMAIFIAHLWTLRAHDERPEPWLAWLHSGGVWLFVLVVSWEVGWQIDHYVEGRRVWPLIAWALVPGAVIALFAFRGERLTWPVREHRRAYLYAGALPVVLFLLMWVLGVNLASDGNPAPLPYVPFFNPLDLAQAGALLAVAGWYIAVRNPDIADAPLPSATAAVRVLSVIVFVWFNGLLLRTLHHYAGVPFRLDAMLRSDLVQTAFSLFWSLLALGTMILAARKKLRTVWLVGAVLFGVVVVKLFLVDLSNTGTVERWVSFIGVGVLAIVIGYFAPVPPKSQETAS